jgi:hypothetical protein
METLLCAAVGTASHLRGLEASNVNYRYGNLLKNDKDLALEEPSVDCSG